MGKKKKKQKVAVSQEPSAGLGGMAAALSARGFASSGKAPAKGASTGASKGASKGAASEAKLGRIVVRQERKGRGGKTVTVLQGVTGDRAAFCKRIKKALGTGARVEGSDIVVQGDQRDSAKAWLEKQGAKVVVGN